MKKLLNGAFLAVEALCNVMMVVQVLVTAYVVVGRYVFNRTPAWGEQLTLLLLVWLGLMSAAITVRENAHIRVSFIDGFLPKRALAALDVVSDVILLLFYAGLLYSGLLLTKMTLRANIPGLSISKAWLYVSVPVASLFLIAGGAENLYRNLFRRVDDKEGSDQ